MAESDVSAGDRYVVEENAARTGDTMTVQAAGTMAFCMDHTGAVTFIAPEIEDEIAGLLWARIADMSYWGYEDGCPFSRLNDKDKDEMRSVARAAVTPVMRWIRDHWHAR